MATITRTVPDGKYCRIPTGKDHCLCDYLRLHGNGGVYCALGFDGLQRYQWRGQLDVFIEKSPACISATTKE